MSTPINELNIDYIKLQKMAFLYNALENGWTIKKQNEQIRVLIGIENYEQYIQPVDERYMSVLEMVQLLGTRGVFIAVMPECPEIDTQDFYDEKEIIKRICVGEHTIPEISFELNNYELYADNISKVVNDVITNIELKSYDVIN